ncbi:Tryptophan--tRNA ligase, mitochondrial [Arachnomyces sp. PD_36]|nr:Tryptophan--tRNA ligase, mitochondrial [Arachnomyces sp. PD_36]
MFSPASLRPSLNIARRLKISFPSRAISGFGDVNPSIKPTSPSTGERLEASAQSDQSPAASVGPAKEWADRLEDIETKFRLPRSVQAIYLKPLKRQAEYGLPVCDLQLRSYSVRNVEFFADFALRAAYYLNLPASGPVPLPRIVERWTVPRSNFVHTKSKENFERITLRRLIQIKDGNPDTVQAWLAFLRKHAFHGVGMKANVWEHERIGVGASMDKAAEGLDEGIDSALSQFGKTKNAQISESVSDLLLRSPRAFTHVTQQHRRHSNSSTDHIIGGPKVIFSGIQPTGVPHLGNFLGALQKWVELQDDAAVGTKLIYSIVDLHALTIPHDPIALRERRRQTLAMLLAVGLDPNRATIFYQSTVPAHSELMWILSTVSSMGYLSRMTQWKSKLKLPEDSTLEDSGARANLKLGLFTYPVLQAADILVHGATHVPVGEDQQQHIEFARDTANSFNHLYGPTLRVPSPLISSAKRVMSLKDPRSKMSKSHTDPRSRISLIDSPEEISKKINQALTDSEPAISYDPVNRPGVSNLIELLCHFDDGRKSCTDIVTEHGSLGLRAFKQLLAEKISHRLAPIRERYLELTCGNNSDYLDSVAENGAQKAGENAHLTLELVKRNVGLI